MEKISLIFLGTSAGVPTAKRNHTGVFIYFNGTYLLFDCGEGIQRQFKKISISPLRINKVFITHLHADHLLGLPGLLQTLAMNDYTKELEIYGPEGISKFIEFTSKFFPIIKNLKLKIKELKKRKEILEFKDFLIFAIKLKHLIPTYGFRLKLKDKLKVKPEIVRLAGGPSLIFKKLKEGKPVRIKGKLIKPSKALIKKKGKNIALVFDTKNCKEIIELVRDTDLLITECVYKSDLVDLAKSYMHLTTLDVASIIKKAKPKKVYLTHISERYEKNEIEILKEVKKFLKNKIKVNLAYDLLKLEI